MFEEGASLDPWCTSASTPLSGPSKLGAATAEAADAGGARPCVLDGAHLACKPSGHLNSCSMGCGSPLDRPAPSRGFHLPTYSRECTERWLADASHS